MENSEDANDSEQILNFKDEQIKIEHDGMHEDLESNESRWKEIFSNHPEQLVKIENNAEEIKSEQPCFKGNWGTKNEALDPKNDNLGLNETKYSFNQFKDWKIKNKALDLKKDDSELNDNSVLPEKNEEKSFKIHKYQQHQLKNVEGNLLKTYKCYYQVIQKCHLARRIPDQVKVFKCDQCSYKTIHKNKLTVHLIQHPEKVHTFKCPQCDYQTIYIEYLKKHLIRHKDPAEVNVFKCEQCGYQTIRKSDLNKHLIRHMNPEEVSMFKCNQCDYQTIRKNDINKHLIRHKNPEEVRWFKCDQCNYRAVRKGNLMRHLQARHKNAEELN